MEGASTSTRVTYQPARLRSPKRSATTRPIGPWETAPVLGATGSGVLPRHRVSSPVDRLVAERGFPRWTAGSRTAAAATRPASAATSNSSIVSSPQFVATSSSISTGNRRACPTVRRHEDGHASARSTVGCGTHPLGRVASLGQDGRIADVTPCRFDASTEFP